MRLWAEKSLFRSVKEVDLDNQHLVDILGEEDHHQEEILVIDEDHTLDHLMEITEDVEDTQVTDRGNIEIEIVNISKVKEETEIDHDQDKRKIRREDKADQIHQENDFAIKKLRPDLYNQGNHSFNLNVQNFYQSKFSKFKINNFNISKINESMNQWIKHINL